ncbi:ABC-three component system middle component 1 [Luxibacter massiliensis]|uniref:ABC-three component system middle component 1 n=1 Tax=Luxibacter massiliensis TaxID=2219695 RepID=UPI000F062415|nr:ABC-three component system middle component 1 [Luxibacter massiliensis]
MKDIICKLFDCYQFAKKWENDDKYFFESEKDNIVSYFIVNFVDCTSIQEDEERIKEALNKLEKEYVNTEKEKSGIKYSIMNSFENKEEIAQLDKNTSAIYLVKFSEENVLSKYRNIIYSIEESPVYFRRYILPYTDKQVLGLKNVLQNYEERSIVDVLTDLADDEDNYYLLLNGKNSNSIYELVVRIFSKIPFVQYQFKAVSDEITLDKVVEDALDSDLKKYDEIVRKGEITLDELIVLEDEDIPESEITQRISKLLEEID